MWCIRKFIQHRLRWQLISETQQWVGWFVGKRRLVCANFMWNKNFQLTEPQIGSIYLQVLLSIYSTTVTIHSSCLWSIYLSRQGMRCFFQPLSYTYPSQAVMILQANLSSSFTLLQMKQNSYLIITLALYVIVSVLTYKETLCALHAYSFCLICNKKQL